MATTQKKPLTNKQLLRLALEAMDAFWEYVNDYSDPLLDYPATVKLNRARRKIRTALQTKK